MLLSWELRNPIEKRHPSISVRGREPQRLSCHRARLRTHRARLRCGETRGSRRELAQFRSVGPGGAFPLPPVLAPMLVLPGQWFGPCSQLTYLFLTYFFPPAPLGTRVVVMPAIPEPRPPPENVSPYLATSALVLASRLRLNLAVPDFRGQAMKFRGS
jgi:hypothetical protein